MEETNLLKKGLNYNLHQKPNNWMENIALEAETAIGRLEPSEQCTIRYLVAKNLEKLIRAKNNRIQKLWAKQETTTIIGNLRKKITDNKLILTKADKGKTIVILHQQEYNQKVVHLMECNHISEITKDPTEKSSSSSVASWSF
jgi:hypothetical protein